MGVGCNTGHAVAAEALRGGGRRGGGRGGRMVPVNSVLRRRAVRSKEIALLDEGGRNH